MEALEIIFPSLQDRYDKITASVAHLDPRLGEPWPKLQTFREYIVSVSDVEKPRCQKCGLNLLWAESVICVGCGTKTELGSRRPPDIEFTSTLAYNRYLDALWASGKLKTEDTDKQGGGDSQWASLDECHSRRGSGSILSSDMRRGTGSTEMLHAPVASGSTGSSSAAESLRGSALDFTSQKADWLGPSTDGPDSASKLSINGGPPSSLTARSGSISSSNAQISGQLFGSHTQTKSMNGPHSGVQNAVVASSNRCGSLSEQSGQAASPAAVLYSQANFLREPLDKSSGPTAHRVSSGSRVSGAPSDQHSTCAADGFDDFGEDEHCKSAGSNAETLMQDFTDFDNEDFFARQPTSNSGSPEGLTSTEHSLLINQLGTLHISQGQVEAPPADSDEASRLVSTLVSQMHDVSFMLADHLVIPSEVRRH